MARKVDQRAAVIERLGARLDRLADLIHGVSRPDAQPEAPTAGEPSPQGTEPRRPAARKVIRGQLGAVGPTVVGTLALR